MPISSQYIGAPVEKQWVKIVAVDTRTRRIDAQLKDYGIVQIAVWEVPNNFRWPKEGETWLVVRENGFWHLRAPRQDENAATHIEDLDHGDTMLGTEGAKIWAQGDLDVTNLDVINVDATDIDVDHLDANIVHVQGVMPQEGLLTSSTLLTDMGHLVVGGEINVQGVVDINGSTRMDGNLSVYDSNLYIVDGDLFINDASLLDFMQVPQAYTIDAEGWTVVREFDPNATTVNTLANVLATFIDDLANAAPLGGGVIEETAVGGVEVFEQADDPDTTEDPDPTIGALWIDTDALASAHVGAPTVTVLPTAPTNGQEVDYVADEANGIIWRLKYRAASASAYKWEVVGGSALMNGAGHELDVLTGAEPTTGTHTTYQDVATVGPSVTVPLAGDYDIHMSAEGFTASAAYGFASFAIGGTPASDHDAMTLYGSVNNQQIARNTRKLAIPAGSLIRMKYRTYSNVASYWARRVLMVTPVRVG